MNYLGVDMYARNRGTRRFGTASIADLETAQPAACPFCGAATTANQGRISQHIERCGFTLCLGGGVQPYIAAERAATLTADYRLPCEGGLE